MADFRTAGCCLTPCSNKLCPPKPNPKFEYRNSKQIQNPNAQMTQTTGVSHFGNLEFWKFGFVSDLRRKAGDGNRTHITSLEGWSFTTKLHPQRHFLFIIFYLLFTILPPRHKDTKIFFLIAGRGMPRRTKLILFFFVSW